jgi:hypothetical protein
MDTVTATQHNWRVFPGPVEFTGLTFPLRDDNANNFIFEPTIKTRVSRAWDRVSTNSKTVRGKGRKIWRRRLRIGDVNRVDITGDVSPEDGRQRGTKRQCVQQMPAVPVKFQRTKQYVPTRHELGPGTPKRKSA